MSIFKKAEKRKESTSSKNKKYISKEVDNIKGPKKTKKKRIGFRRKEKWQQNKPDVESTPKPVQKSNFESEEIDEWDTFDMEEDNKESVKNKPKTMSKSIQPKKINKKVKDKEKIDDSTSEIARVNVKEDQDHKEIIENKSEPNKEKEWFSSKKKRMIVPKDMRGKPVYLEDTGEKLGKVFSLIYDKEKNLVGYKIKDNKSNAVMSFPVDQFDEDKNGLIFVPSWYTKGLKTIEKLEFKDRVSPELGWLLKDNTISDEELYNIFVKHDDKIKNYIEDAVALRKVLNQRLKIFERERLTLKENLMDLTERRLIKDIDRRKFSEDVSEHRRKVNILDINIKKCKNLIKKLESTSFGMISKNKRQDDEKVDREHINTKAYSKKEDKNEIYDKIVRDSFKDEFKDIKEKYNELQNEYNNFKQESFENKEDDSYFDKYNILIEQYDELQEDYNNLKMALESKIEDPYEDKYKELMTQYEELQDEYSDLKVAVEKLLQKK